LQDEKLFPTAHEDEYTVWMTTKRQTQKPGPDNSFVLEPNVESMHPVCLKPDWYLGRPEPVKVKHVNSENPSGAKENVQSIALQCTPLTK